MLYRVLVLAAALTGLMTQMWADERPNIILVMTDDQGYGDLSCHGNPLLTTRHLDQLAAQSVRLTDFHVSPMCTPTRGQLLTGLDAFRNGAMNVSSGRTLLRPELQTMADVFRAAGYRTGIFGKWHLGDNYPFRPEDRGFDETVWFPSSHINSVPDYWDNDYFADTYIRNGQRRQFAGYCTDVFFSEAMKWIASGKESQPFFAYIPLNAAHWPHFVPERYREPIRAAMAQRPEVVQHLGEPQRAALVSFLAMIANIDENVGRLDNFLESQDLLANTIFVFLTDNGSTMGQDYYNAGMRGKKTQLWEGGHRVPCFIRWPQGSIQPRDIDELCHAQDLLPTLAELSGVGGLPPRLDGQSLAPVLRGETSQLGERLMVINYSRMPTFRTRYTRTPELPAREGAAVLWKKWRLLEDRELYDLSTDPHQDRDVAAEHPEVVAKLRAHLDEWWDGVKETVMEPQRVIIGNARDNPTLLTACEWLDVFVDQQVQIRRGDRKNGSWHLLVDQAGIYTLELRRWPRESGLKLTAAAPRVTVTDGVYAAGVSLPIESAVVEIANQRETLQPAADGQSFRLQLELPAGPTELRTALLDAGGQEICGAYYVYVHRHGG